LNGTRRRTSGKGRRRRWRWRRRRRRRRRGGEVVRLGLLHVELGDSGTCNCCLRGAIQSRHRSQKRTKKKREVVSQIRYPTGILLLEFPFYI
jgi:hypothetical protein